jgi:hypothetical protein
MPSEELIDAVRQSTLRPSFSNSRDYKGPNFESYINPNFYRGDMPAWQGLVIRDQLRQNGEIYAFNEPHITEFELRNFQVSPVIPTGIYKKNTIARVYYWKDGQQIMKRYRLISLDDVNPQQITDQVFQNFLSSMVEWSAEFWGSKFMNAITFGIGKPVSEGLNILKREIDGSDVYGVWVQEGSLTENLSTVTGRAPAVGLLDSMELNNETISGAAGSSGSPLPLLLAGVGLVTGNLWLSGIGLLLRLRR